MPQNDVFNRPIIIGLNDIFFYFVLVHSLWFVMVGWTPIKRGNKRNKKKSVSKTNVLPL